MLFNPIWTNSQAFPTGLGNQSLLVLPVSVLTVRAGKSPETQETKEDARNTMLQDGSTEGVFFRELTVLYWAGLCGPVPALVLPAGPLDLQPPLAPKGKKAASLVTPRPGRSQAPLRSLRLKPMAMTATGTHQLFGNADRREDNGRARNHACFPRGGQVGRPVLLTCRFPPRRALRDGREGLTRRLPLHGAAEAAMERRRRSRAKDIQPHGSARSLRPAAKGRRLPVLPPFVTQ